MAVMTSAHVLLTAVSRLPTPDAYCNPIATHARASPVVETRRV